MKGVAWDGVGAPQLESAKKAGELISDVCTFLPFICGCFHLKKMYFWCIRCLKPDLASAEKVSSAAGQPQVHLGDRFS